jgi:hypothetical protein
MTETIAVDRTQISAAIGRALDETRRTLEALLGARSAITAGGNVRPVFGYRIYGGDFSEAAQADVDRAEKNVIEFHCSEHLRAEDRARAGGAV